MTSIQPRQPAGRPTGGQFGTIDRPEGAPALPTPTRVRFPVAFVVDERLHDRAPVWPDDVPRYSRAELCLNDSDGEAHITYVWDDIDGESASLSVWGDQDDVYDSHNDGDEPLPFDEDQADGIMGYVGTHYERVRQSVDALKADAVTAAHDQILALADGGSLTDVIGASPESDHSRSNAQRATSRVEKVASLFYDTDDKDGTEVADLLADLRHYADAKGLDFDELIDRGHRSYSDDLEDDAITVG